jgi:hypothetical protein
LKGTCARGSDAGLYCPTFIRNDVHEPLMKGGADYGIDMRVVLDWTDPDMQREMLRLRLVSGIQAVDGAVTIEQVRRTICV